MKSSKKASVLAKSEDTTTSKKGENIAPPSERHLELTKMPKPAGSKEMKTKLDENFAK